MKRILFFSTFIGLVLPSVLIAEVTRITCSETQWRHRFPTKEYEDKFLEKWYKTSSSYSFTFDEKNNYVFVYFPNKSFDRGTNLVKFRPDTIKFNLPKKDQGQERYILDNYDINRRNGDFLRVFKMFNSENNQLTFEMQEKGKCKKSNLK